MESLTPLQEKEWLDIKQYLYYSDGELFIFHFPSTIQISWQNIKQLFSRFYIIRSIEYQPIKNYLTIKIHREERVQPLYGDVYSESEKERINKLLNA